MGPQLEKLYELHQLTLKLYQLRQQIESLNRRARVNERKLAETSQQIDAKKQEIQATQAAAHQADLSLKSREASLEKLRAQLNTTRTNKEYSALLREINTFKADSAHLEEDALRKMSAVDEQKAELEKLNAQLADERGQLDKIREQSRQREESLKDDIAQIEAKRQNIEADLPPAVRVQFNRVAEAHEGEAMAVILQPNAKRMEYICGGCNMGVTLETVNTLQSRDELQTCNVCGRLLFLNPSDSPAR